MTKEKKIMFLCDGMYAGIRKYYEKQHELKYIKDETTNFRYFYIPGAYIFGGSCGMERWLLNEPVSYLQTIDWFKIPHFGHGKKENQMKIIFENLGFDWRVN